MSAAVQLPSDLSGRLVVIIDGLCAALAACMARNPAARLVLMLAWRRVRRVWIRFAALAAASSDAITAAPPRRRRAVPPRTASARPPRAGTRLPGGFAWLFRLMPGAACYGSQLRHLLSDPDMEALLRASPEAGRILRPLCRMLAVRPLPAILKPPRSAEPAGATEPADAPLDCPREDPPWEPSGRAAGRAFEPGRSSPQRCGIDFVEAEPPPLITWRDVVCG